MLATQACSTETTANRRGSHVGTVCPRSIHHNVASFNLHYHRLLGTPASCLLHVRARQRRSHRDFPVFFLDNLNILDGPKGLFRAELALGHSYTSRPTKRLL
jgi:hypothetical protein